MLPLRDQSGNVLLDIHPPGLSTLDSRVPVPASFVVVTLNGDVLMIFDRWRAQWELPGGMREPDETPLQAAARELTEETGIGEVDLAFVAVAEFDLRTPPRREYAAIYRTTLTTPPRLMVNDEAADFRWWPTDSPLPDRMCPLDAEIARHVLR